MQRYTLVLLTFKGEIEKQTELISSLVEQAEEKSQKLEENVLNLRPISPKWRVVCRMKNNVMHQRRKNIIISGVPEPVSGSIKERKEFDTEK